MLKNARKRCQATPIVEFSEMVIIQAKEITILSVATAQITSCSEPTDVVSNSPLAMGAEKKYCMEKREPFSSAASAPRSTRMQSRTPRIVYST